MTSAGARALAGRPYAIALLAGSLVLAAATAVYAVAFATMESPAAGWTVFVADLAISMGSLAFAWGIASGRVRTDTALNRIAVTLMAAAFVSGLIEIAVDPERAAQVTAHGCIVLIAACVVIRTLPPIVTMLCAAPVAWYVVASQVPASTGFEASRWLPTYGFTGLVAAGVLMMTRTERRAYRDANRRIEIAAMADPLTGMLNRRGFGQRAVALGALAQRLDQPMWCAFVDVDRFKQVNDQWGHDTGDSVLVAVAHAVARAARAADTSGRWGGDEFVLLGIGEPPGEDDLERRILSNLEEIDPTLGSRWTPGVTVGIATSSADPSDSLALISDADRRMYERRGRRRAEAPHD